MFLLIDMIIWLICLKIVRWIMTKLVPPDAKPEDRGVVTTLVDKYRRMITEGIAALFCLVLVTLSFKGLVHWKNYFEEPHFLLGIAITIYLAGSTLVDGMLPDIPT